MSEALFRISRYRTRILGQEVIFFRHHVSSHYLKSIFCMKKRVVLEHWKNETREKTQFTCADGMVETVSIVGLCLPKTNIARGSKENLEASRTLH